MKYVKLSSHFDTFLTINTKLYGTSFRLLFIIKQIQLTYIKLKQQHSFVKASLLIFENIYHHVRHIIYESNIILLFNSATTYTISFGKIITTRNFNEYF